MNGFMEKLEDDNSLIEIANLLNQHGLTLAVAESCTGGLLSAALTTIPGASSFFIGGIVSYNNSVKENQLGVQANVLKEYGAVSEPVAKAMTEGVAQLLGSDLAIGITGIAGPSSDFSNKPVGLVYIGFANNHGTQVICFNFSGDRDSIRQQSVKTALNLLKDNLQNI